MSNRSVLPHHLKKLGVFQRSLQLFQHADDSPFSEWGLPLRALLSGNATAVHPIVGNPQPC
jgi:hypothetical protein